MATSDYSEPVQGLATIGRPGRKLNYTAEFGIGAEHVPELIELGLEWADDDREWSNDGEAYAPLHAWRALGQLRAEAAVAPLLSMFNHLDEAGDDWWLEEFPRVFGAIGAPALREYLFDTANRESARVGASHGLREIARDVPETRSEVVQTLTKLLDRREANLYYLNAACISDLIDLGAVESAETIERAFSAGVVDVGYAGDWENVRKILGVAGLGLPQPARPYDSLEPVREFASLLKQVSPRRQRQKDRKELQTKLKQYRKKRK